MYGSKGLCGEMKRDFDNYNTWLFVNSTSFLGVKCLKLSNVQMENMIHLRGKL